MSLNEQWIVDRNTHVVQKPNTRRDLNGLRAYRAWTTVEIEVDMDLCLVGIPRDGCSSGGAFDLHPSYARRVVIMDLSASHYGFTRVQLRLYVLAHTLDSAACSQILGAP